MLIITFGHDRRRIPVVPIFLKYDKHYHNVAIHDNQILKYF